jgi:hypothetical protein
MALTVTNNYTPTPARYMQPYGYELRKQDEANGAPPINGMASTGGQIAAPNDTFNGVFNGSPTQTGDLMGFESAGTPPSNNPEPGGSWWNDGSQLGDYDSYINTSFNHAMRTLDPMIRKNEDRFSQSMIDKGFSGNSEGYQDAYDNNSRRYNDLINAAAFNAMNFGGNRMDNDRNFALNELSTIDNMNRAWDGIGYRNAVFNTGREDQRFNQMLSLFGMTPVGSVAQTNMGNAFANSGNAQFGALNAQNQMYGQAAQGIQDAIGAVDWGKIFNSWGFGGSSGGPSNISGVGDGRY